IELAPLEILCLKCDQTSILEENVFKCPKCQSIEYKITQGEDLHLMRLVME
ncbi:hydrogenase/urease maturation nickel metallochaperone HypA, partial [Campylobacter jejuni]